MDIGGREFEFELVRGSETFCVTHMFDVNRSETHDVTECVEVNTEEWGLLKVMDGDRLTVRFHSGNDDQA